MIKKKKKFRTATWGNIRQERNPEITSLLSSDTKITVAAWDGYAEYQPTNQILVF